MSSITDTIKIAYKVLFSLQVELEGYPDDVNPFMKIVPDSTTEDLFTKYKILSRKSQGASVILIETEPEGTDKGKPEIMPENNELFSFQLKMDTTFLSGTHLADYNFTDNVLYLSNSANNVVSSDILMSLPLQAYHSADSYEKGYLVKSGSKYYRAIQASDSSNAQGVTKTAYWKEINSLAFISQADLRSRSSLSEPADLDTIMVIEVLNSASLSADYQLLDGSLKCKEVIYKIRLHT